MTKSMTRVIQILYQISFVRIITLTVYTAVNFTSNVMRYNYMIVAMLVSLRNNNRTQITTEFAYGKNEIALTS